MKMQFLHLLAFLALLPPPTSPNILPQSASSTFPDCGLHCATLLFVQEICEPPNVVQSTQLTYDNCFCQSTFLTPFNTTPDAICLSECTVASDRQLVQTWYIDFCRQVNQGIDPAGTANTSTMTSSSEPSHTTTYATILLTQTSVVKGADGSSVGVSTEIFSYYVTAIPSSSSSDAVTSSTNALSASSTSSSTSMATTSSSVRSSLSGGAIGGIVAGVVVALLILGGLAYLFWRSRTKRLQTSRQKIDDLPTAGIAVRNEKSLREKAELPGQSAGKGVERHRAELMTSSNAHEIDGRPIDAQLNNNNG